MKYTENNIYVGLVFTCGSYDYEINTIDKDGDRCSFKGVGHNYTSTNHSLRNTLQYLNNGSYKPKTLEYEIY